MISRQIKRIRTLFPTAFAFFLTSTKSRNFLLFLIAVFSILIYVNPRLYHRSPGEIIPLLPSTHPSVQLEHALAAINRNLTSLFAQHGKTASEPVFPVQALTEAQEKRYSVLKSTDSDEIYMFTTIVRQIEDQVVDLLSAITVIVSILGSDKVAFSILEGPSDDLTPLALSESLTPHLLALGVPAHRMKIVTDEPKIDFNTGNRIEILAELRNRAMEPLWQEGEWRNEKIKQVIFFNDVYLKAEHMLEVMYQHEVNGADVSTAWDWYRREPAWYYDIWVGRTIDTGDLFYPIPKPWWTASEELFPDSPETLAAFQNLDPFQVYSSWNGLAVLNPRPFLPPHNVRFRRSHKATDEGELNECASSECTLICTDFWKNGFGKVQVVPSVQLAYERDVSIQTEYKMQEQRKRLGWTQGVPPSKGRFDRSFEWKTKPPSKVRCNPWPEVNGLSGNVWEKTEWVDPWPGYKS